MNSNYVSGKAKKIALARLSLLKQWKDYRMTTYTRVTDADREFVNAYNAGFISDEIKKIIKKISVQTLYNWERQLNGSSDWTLLVPGYYRTDGYPNLTQEEASTFMKFILYPNKIKIGTAIRLTIAALQNKGIQTDKSPMTFRRFAEKFKKEHLDRWTLLREGQKALKDKVEPYIVRDVSALEVGDVLVADGHRLNSQVINPHTGKPCRPVLVGYVDWKSYDLVGYEIMVEENTQCIASALRNAIIRLGRIPKITYQDNGKAFRSRFFTGVESLEDAGIYGLFARLGIIPMFAQPYNARSKIIERWFKEFSDTFERLLPSFTGTSIEDKPAWMLRNEKFHKAMHREYIPTIEETIQMIEKWLEFLRSRECPHVKGKTIGEVFEESKQQIQDSKLNIQELDDLMMAVKKTTITRNGVRFLGADYYDENLYGYREEVIVKYSLFDLSKVKIYTPKGEFLCEAKRVPSVHPAAYYLGDPKDMEEFKQQISLQKRVERRTLQISKDTLCLLGDEKQKAIDTALPWQQIVEVSPRVIEKLEKSNISLQPVEKRIPEECVGDCHVAIAPRNDVIASEAKQSEDSTVSHLEPLTRPIFQTATERYEWHLKFGMFTDEDRAWCNWFITTPDFKMLYTYFENQQKGG
jgi:putative transposase